MNSITLPFSAACERNKDVIQTVLSKHLETLESVLEIGSGTAQHAIHFAQNFPNLTWQTSDQLEYLEGIRGQLACTELDNVLAPIELNVNQLDWAGANKYQAVYTANTFHIMSAEDVQAFFAGIGQVVTEQALLFVYGPFKYTNKFTSDSNRIFDQSLRERGGGSAIRDFEWVDQLAQSVGFKLKADHLMPANNQCLVWQME